jgi:transcriptional regulator with XRE-family HTH domain
MSDQKGQIVFVSKIGIMIHHRFFIRRRALGLTQQQVADAAGISRNYVSLIERGNLIGVTLKTLVNYAEALGWGLDIRLVEKEESEG